MTDLGLAISLLARVNGNGGAAPRDADLYPYSPRSVIGRLVNEGNAKVVSASASVGEYGKSRVAYWVPSTALPGDEIVPLMANFALPSGTGSFNYGTVVTTVSGSNVLTLTAGPLPTVGVVITGTGIPANAVVGTAAGTTITMVSSTGAAVNATASASNIAITTNNFGEVAGGAGTLEALIIDNNSGTRTTFPFGGGTGSRAFSAHEVFMGDRGVKLSDLGLVAGQMFYAETCDLRAAGTLRPGGNRLFAALGEAFSYGATSRVDVTPATATKTVSNWAPLAFLFSGKPASKRAHVFTGDSLGMGVSSLLGGNTNSKGEQGYIPIAMVARDEWFLNMTKDGTKASEAGGPPTNLAGGTFNGRNAVISALKSVATNALSNLDVVNELATNDTTGSLTTFQDRMNSLYTKLAATGLPIKQLTSLLRANSTDYWASNANQTTAAVTAVGTYIPTQGAVPSQQDYLAATNNAAAVESWFASLVGSTLRANYNSRPKFAQATSGAGANLWTVTRAPLTLGAAVALGASTMSAPAGLQLGDWIVFEPGTTNQETRQISDITAGTATLNAVTQFAHAQGVTLQPAPTGDGLHPGPDNHARVGALMAVEQAFADFLNA